MAATEAKSKMDPAGAHFQTIFASICGRLYFPDLIEMLAITRHQHASAIEETGNLVNSALPLTFGMALCYRMA